MNYSLDGNTVVVATMHDKQTAIGPLFQSAFHCSVVVPENFDTNQFGTFSRTIPRLGSQLEAAREKARAALELTGHSVAIASEGSFHPHPLMPFLMRNLELVVLIDQTQGVEVIGQYETMKQNMAGQWVETLSDLEAFAIKVGFPDHGLLLRLDPESPDLLKDFDSLSSMKESASLLFKSCNRIYVETDMRAHRNPTRMLAIQAATVDLLKNLKSNCPNCRAPGYREVSQQTGLPCESCGTPTGELLSHIWHCPNCEHTESKAAQQEGVFGNPGMCPVCNP